MQRQAATLQSISRSCADDNKQHCTSWVLEKLDSVPKPIGVVITHLLAPVGAGYELVEP